MSLDQQEEGRHPNRFIDNLISRMGEPLKFSSTYRLSHGPTGSEQPDSILEFLELGSGDLSPVAHEALDALESTSSGDDDWCNLKWKLTAFTYLQDIFDSVIHDSVDDNSLILLEQYYFYYESQRILRESILCGLNGLETASCSLLRPFLEFSLLQNYYYRLVNARRSFEPLQRYFLKGISPSTNAILRKALPNDAFAKPIHARLRAHLSGLSASTLHPYHPNHSNWQHKNTVHAHSLESLYFWYTIELVLDAALWAYYVNFPMLFHPVDVTRKFGYNGPIGIFIDNSGGLCIRKSLNSEDYEQFVEYSSRQDHAKSCLEFYKNRSDLTDGAIEATWHGQGGEQFPGIQAAYCQAMAKTRSLKVALALRRDVTAKKATPGQSFDTFSRLSFWKTLAKKGGQRRIKL